MRGWRQDSGTLASYRRKRDRAEGNFSRWHGRDLRRKQAAADERGKLRVSAQRNAAFWTVQRRNHRAGPWSRPVQSELGKSVRRAAAGCSVRRRAETVISLRRRKR